MKKKKDASSEEAESTEAEAQGTEGAPEELEQALAERAEYLANWQRAQADYQNLRRRAAEDLEAGVRRKLEPLLSDLLLVADHLDMALASPAETEDAKNMRFGIELVRKQAAQLLENAGVEAIDESGPFDPSLHQAVSKIEEEGREREEIQTTVRRGFLFEGRPLRFAQVVVATPPAEVEVEAPVEAPVEEPEAEDASPDEAAATEQTEEV